MAGFIMRQHTWKGQNFYDIDTDSVSGREQIVKNYKWRKKVINGDELPETLPSQEDMVSYLNEVNTDNNNSSSSSYPYCLERAKIILKKIADMLIATGTGWELDTTKHTGATDTDDFKVIHTSDGDMGVYFYMRSVEHDNETTIINEKLLLGYTFTGVRVKSMHTYISSSSNYNTNNYYVTGLFSAMIPAGSVSEFGDVWDAEGFLPFCSTKIHASNTSSSGTLAKDNKLNTAYHAQVVTNGHILAFRIYAGQSCGSWWFVGPLIGTLAHSTMDITEQAKLMDMGFTECSNEADENPNYSNGDSISSGNTENGIWRNYIQEKTSYGRRCQIHMFAADGTLLEGNGGKEIFWDGAISQVASCVSDSSVVGFNRWVAIYIGVMSQEPSSPGNYIVRGDGMKGYLDTNFLRYVRRNYYTFGQTFDDGNFIYIGHGVAMGWDPSNGALNAN